jgi:hypothetical protein
LLARTGRQRAGAPDFGDVDLAQKSMRWDLPLRVQYVLLGGRLCPPGQCGWLSGKQGACTCRMGRVPSSIYVPHGCNLQSGDRSLNPSESWPLIRGLLWLTRTHSSNHDSCGSVTACSDALHTLLRRWGPKNGEALQNLEDLSMTFDALMHREACVMSANIYACMVLTCLKAQTECMSGCTLPTRPSYRGFLLAYPCVRPSMRTLTQSQT